MCAKYRMPARLCKDPLTSIEIRITGQLLLLLNAQMLIISNRTFKHYLISLVWKSLLMLVIVNIRLLDGKLWLLKSQCKDVHHHLSGRTRESRYLNMLMYHWGTLDSIGYYILLMYSFQEHYMITNR